MDSDTAILVGVITAVFAGVAGIIKMMLPFIAKRRTDPPAAMAAPTVSAPAIANPPPADGTGPHAAVDASRLTPEPPWGDLSKTLHDMKSSFATKEDVEALSTTMSKRLDDSETRAEKNVEKTQDHLTKLERSMGRIEGMLDK